MYPTLLSGAKPDIYRSLMRKHNAVFHLPLNDGPPSINYLDFNHLANTDVNYGSAASIDDIPLITDMMTVEVFYKMDPTYTGQYQAIIGKYTAGNGWLLCVDSSSRAFGIVRVGGTQLGYAHTHVLTDGDWHHIVMVYDNVLKRLATIVDGDYLSYSTGSGAYDTDISQILKQGEASSGSQVLGGSVAWSRISTTDRYGVFTTGDFTPPAITDIPVDDSDTELLVPMNEGYGNEAVDLSGNNNHGTITNGSWNTYPSAKDVSPTGGHSTYEGSTLQYYLAPSGIGGRAPLFDGVADVVNVYTTNLSDVVSLTDVCDEGSFVLWVKAFNSGIWTDGLQGFAMRIQSTNNDFFAAQRTTTDNQFLIRRQVGGYNQQFIITDLTTTDWFMVAFTWSINANETKCYFNGSQYGPTNTSAMASWGSYGLNTTRAAVGAFQGVSPTGVWNGGISNFSLHHKILSDADISDIYLKGV